MSDNKMLGAEDKGMNKPQPNWNLKSRIHFHVLMI